MPKETIVIFEIKSDTGLISTHKWAASKAPKTQAQMRSAMDQYGEWIYSGNPYSEFEYRNTWLPKLNAAKSFTITQTTTTK